jgi:WD40 repeat protein
MTAPQDPARNPGSNWPAGRQVASRGGLLRLLAILSRDWVSVLAALVGGGIIYLARPPQSAPATRVALKEGAGQVRSLLFPNDGGMLAATVLDETIRPWRVDAGRGQAAPRGSALLGFVAAFSPDGTTLAAGGDSTVVFCATAGDGDNQRRTVRTETGRTSAVAFSGDGETLAVAGADRVTFWETASARPRVGRPSLSCQAIALAFAPDGRSLATAGRDGFVRIWDLATARQRVAVRAHQSLVAPLAFSDDGRTLATASDDDCTPVLRDAATGRALKWLRGNTCVVLQLAFAPGGRTVAAAAADGTVRLWDVATGRERFALRCDGLAPMAIAFSPDGRTLAAGGIEPLVVLWDVSGSVTSW